MSNKTLILATASLLPSTVAGSLWKLSFFYLELDGISLLKAPIVALVEAVGWWEDILGRIFHAELAG